MTRTDPIEPRRIRSLSGARGVSAGARSGSILPPAAFNEALYRRVKELRLAAGLSQAKVAEGLGVPKQTYVHFEKRSPLPAHLIVPFADLVGVDLRYLLTGETWPISLNEDAGNATGSQKRKIGDAPIASRPTARSS